MAKSLGRNSDNGVGVPILAERLAEHVGVAGEVTLPEIVADDARAGESIGAVARLDEASERGFSAEEFENS